MTMRCTFCTCYFLVKSWTACAFWKFDLGTTRSARREESRTDSCGFSGTTKTTRNGRMLFRPRSRCGTRGGGVRRYFRSIVWNWHWCNRLRGRMNKIYIRSFALLLALQIIGFISSVTTRIASLAPGYWIGGMHLWTRASSNFTGNCWLQREWRCLFKTI